jgi:hypothetical protein
MTTISLSHVDLSNLDEIRSGRASYAEESLKLADLVHANLVLKTPHVSVTVTRPNGHATTVSVIGDDANTVLTATGLTDSRRSATVEVSLTGEIAKAARIIKAAPKRTYGDRIMQLAGTILSQLPYTITVTTPFGGTTGTIELEPSEAQVLSSDWHDGGTGPKARVHGGIAAALGK